MEIQSLCDICDYRKGKTLVSDLTLKNYVSTENLLPNKGGLVDATSLPSTETTQVYFSGDVLVSNIRPYFKKILLAKENGGCSNDVLVFKAKPGVDSTFLYYVLSNDNFFDYSTASSKGTKMPRGDKSAIMQYKVPKVDIDVQRKIGAMLRSIDEKIEVNNAINRNLEEQAKSIFNERFIDINTLPNMWREMALKDVAILNAGGDKPKIVSNNMSDTCKIPIYSNGITDEGLYGYTEEPKIIKESVTVSARGTIGYVCLRQEPYVPIVRLISVIPKENVMTAKYLYFWLESLHIMGTGTTQQQLTVPNFKNTKIIVPTLDEIKDFSHLVDPMYTTILKNKKQNIKLSKLRDNLLPKLMSGEIDIMKLEV